MEQNEIIARVNAICEAAEDKEATLKDALLTSVRLLNEADPDTAADFLEGTEGGLSFYNFLTEKEATTILADLRNQDGSAGAKWKDAEAFFKKVETLDAAEIENAPLYNKWALWVAMNLVFSDYNSTLIKYTDGDALKYLDLCYNLAVNKLSDVDRPRFIRAYFGL